MKGKKFASIINANAFDSLYILIYFNRYIYHSSFILLWVELKPKNLKAIYDQNLYG